MLFVLGMMVMVTFVILVDLVVSFLRRVVMMMPLILIFFMVVMMVSLLARSLQNGLELSEANLSAVVLVDESEHLLWIFGSEAESFHGCNELYLRQFVALALAEFLERCCRACKVRLEEVPEVLEALDFPVLDLRLEGLEIRSPDLAALGVSVDAGEGGLRIKVVALVLQRLVEEAHIYRITATEDLLKHGTEVAIYTISTTHPSDESHLRWNAFFVTRWPLLSALSAELRVVHELVAADTNRPFIDILAVSFLSSVLTLAN
mmetsp:Transcript_93716/g.242622  ORF Transcript_93716/g.242622 Transcript_93716/m.242622 type:complete len:262 (-) Transcript_93716:106-891(-)